MKNLIRSGVLALTLVTATAVVAPVVVAADSAVIVMYHRFGENVHPSTNIHIAQFEAHLKELAKPEYTVLPLPEIIARLKVVAVPRFRPLLAHFTTCFTSNSSLPPRF